LGGFRRDVAPRWSGAPGGDDDAALLAVAQFDQRLFDAGTLVGDQPRHRFPRARENLRETIADRGPALVLVTAATGPVGNRHDADAHGGCHVVLLYSPVRSGQR